MMPSHFQGEAVAGSSAFAGQGGVLQGGVCLFEATALGGTDGTGPQTYNGKSG